MDTGALHARGTALGIAGLVLSAAFMAGVHIVGSGQINPVDSTLSALVFVDGYGWMFGASVLAMALAATGLVLALPGSGPRSHRLLRPTLALVAFCCVLVAVFPTNHSGPLTVSAEIHRYAAGAAFFLVPVAALLVALRLDRTAAHRRRLLLSMAATAGILVVFLVSHFGLVPREVQDLRGVFQRMMFAVQLVLLVQLLQAFQPERTRSPITVRQAPVPVAA